MRLEEIRTLIAGATAGPWRGRDAHLSFVESAHGIAVIGGDHAVYNGADDRFICAARTLMPLLLDVARDARAFFDDVMASDILMFADRKAENDLFASLHALESADV